MGVMAKQLSALRLHSERSDCFRDASSALQSSCESLQFDPSERVRVAVEMTLCELATAERISLPLECKRMKTKSSQKSVSQCVEALARSAQHWSSYSGYLREIPQLCIAYRRLHEIDHAKSIYANITNEKLAFFSSLNDHYMGLSLRQRELADLTEGLGSLVRILEQYSSSLEHSIETIPHKASDLTTQIQAKISTLWDDILADAQALNQRSLTSFEGHLAVILSEVTCSAITIWS
ncbi:Nuclear fusion protein KAR5 OS=Debaryomyces hansenii (strain ATCC 36239 / CBS 767 / JCM 1990 / NBRC 0083 / IGC 2968) GN=KAR5 PE=3 SV=2 [Rhizoctonia solani AG-1 IB]|uniref:Nuclear fusion protein KAR5 n=1 Tax=Thanatephorus cucumeris (strain AG1-IB / isolate 7/3/14) TaxID=1108050 RepID=A0A0B7FC34_THACB|nr:Nuclear fusion protein KAR5 OS=Debaryomyces hansenii (strain ATCC 36239 / CBS 767 / JCM 1990 / NBRC 0083 / IGC 2968) GN=KAR5 PE=3 SV=2 [Rhizoctonia solani AG-1 IB]